MALIKKGNNYFIDYRFDGRRIREKVGPNQRQALLVLSKRKVEIAENKFLDVRKETKTTFFQMCDLFMETYSKPNKSSWKDDEYILKKLKNYFGNIRLSKFSRQLIEEYKALRVLEVSKTRVNLELACLKTLFNRAIEWNKAASNPVRGIKLFKLNNQRTRYLEKGDLDNLISASINWLATMIQIAVNTGMRQKEILSLHWDDFDFNRKFVHVRTAKNGEGRFIPINDILLKVMDNYPKCPDSPFVFTKPDGKPHTRFGYLRTAFNQAVKKAGIRDFHFHDLRHTFASHLVMAGVDLKTVAELLGHKTGYKMTERYAHLSPQHKMDAVNKLNKLSSNENLMREEKVDTFWTPKQYPAFEVLWEKLNITLENQSDSASGRVAELADAQDLKS